MLIVEGECLDEVVIAVSALDATPEVVLLVFVFVAELEGTWL